MSSALRPEFGPSLPTLAGPRWRKLSRPARGLAVLLAVVLIAFPLVFARLHGQTAPLLPEVVTAPVAFNLAHKAALSRVPPPPGALLALSTVPGTPVAQRFVVRPFRLPAHPGDLSVGLMLGADALARQMARSDPDFVFRGDGRVRVNFLPGYAFSYQTLRDGKRVLGKRYVLVPEAADGQPQPTAGADLTLESGRSAGVPNVDAIGMNGALKTPLRSFRFGTERP